MKSKISLTRRHGITQQLLLTSLLQTSLSSALIVETTNLCTTASSATTMKHTFYNCWSFKAALVSYKYRNICCTFEDFGNLFISGVVSVKSGRKERKDEKKKTPEEK